MLEKIARYLRFQDPQVNILTLEPDICYTAESIRINFVKELLTIKSVPYSFRFHNFQGTVETPYKDIFRMLKGTHLIFAIGPHCALWAREALGVYKEAIPVVFVDVKDPVGLKLVESYDKPGGTMTGVLSFDDNYPERLEHLPHLVHNLRKLLIVHDPLDIEGRVFHEKNKITHFLSERGIVAYDVGIRYKAEVRHSIQSSISQLRPDVVFVMRSTMLMASMHEIAACAQAYKVPLYASDIQAVKLGAAMGCGNYDAHIGQQAGRQASLITTSECDPGTIALSRYTKPYILVASKDNLIKQGLTLNEKALNWLQHHGEII